MEVSFVKMCSSWVYVTLIALFLTFIMSPRIGNGQSSDLPSNDALCKATNTCNASSACEFPSRFEDGDCTKGCARGHWGSHCEQECNQNCIQKSCTVISGHCDKGCDPYIPLNCTTLLVQPIISLTNEELGLNHTAKPDQIGQNYIRFEIRQVQETGDEFDWQPLNITLTWNGYWETNKSSVPPKLQANESYEVRAVVDKTKGLSSPFNTSQWEPSVPHNFTVIYLNESITKLRWKYDGKYWEKTAAFYVNVEELGSGLQNDSSTRFPEQKIPVTEKQEEYNTTLNVTRVMNYTVSVKVLDENAGMGAPVTAWYFFLDRNNLAQGRRAANNTVTLISFKIPLLSNKTENDTVNVIINGSYTCPELFPMNGIINENSVDLSKLENLTSNEYPACQLRLNETWLFPVILEEEPTSSWLIWLITLLISALAIFTLSVLFRKYKSIFALVTLTSPSLKRDRNIPLLSQEFPPDNSTSLKVQELRKFEDNVRRAAEDGVLQQQFMSLPRGLMQSCKSGKLPQNRPKNRYGNLIAYDATRVILARDLDSPSTDYINASYIQGYCKERAYIATQAPLPETMADFWTMIWQEEVHIICMLVDLGEGGQNACERYWPEGEEEIKYGKVVVSTVDQRVSTDFTYRTFTVKKQGARRSRTVQHLQYTGWPKEGVPMYSHSVVEYIHKLLSLPPGQGPIVVHCGTGTGRTGAIILCDICLRHLSAEGTMDVFSEAKTMYSARANMLTNFAQYVLPHLVPTQCLLSIPSKVLCADLTQMKIEEMKKDLPGHIKRLKETSWMDKAMRQIQPIRPPAEENIRKNRFRKLMPVGDSVVTLSRYPTYDINSDYISAVSVDGAKIKKQYIASQLPMPSTLTDFWRLIVEKDIELIIILQRPDLDDDTCCDIIPRGTLIPLPYLKVETKRTESSSEFFTTDHLLLTDMLQEPWRSRNITALTCNNWGHDQITRPPTPEALVDLWVASEGIPRPEGHTLVVCYDGVTGCGLYLALSFMLDRMAVEQECDVILAVRAVRRSRPEFVISQWQFEYLYDAALTYVNSFGDYANFIAPRESAIQPEQWP